MKIFKFLLGVSLLIIISPAQGRVIEAEEAKKLALTPHKALYDIDLVATRSGSQILNISGQMFYEWKASCDAWITDHRFSLFYEYADSPGMRITSDFTTFEEFDGNSFNFSSRRKRDGELYQELRGFAETSAENLGEARYSLPENLNYDLEKGTLFPMSHTLIMLDKIKTGRNFFSATVFDGSDEEGPVEINTFIGKKANPMSQIQTGPDMDMNLVNTPAWNIRMAVFPESKPQEIADYEMSMVFHENGVISDMLIEYDDFSVTQKLVAIEPIEMEDCKAVSSPIEQ